jgi:hypothetical protein
MKLSGIRRGIISVYLVLAVFAFVQSAYAFTEESPFEVSLITYSKKETLQVGLVKAWNDQTNLYIKYETSLPWCLLETHMDVDTSLENIPQKNGNPIPGRFLYQSSECSQVVQYAIPLSVENQYEWVSETELFLASHATIKNTENDLIMGSAWGIDLAVDPPCCSFSGKNWASYFTYTIPLDFKYVFVTSAKGTGNLGSWPEAEGKTGLEAADNICQTLAGNAGIPGIYKAWISSDQISAAERLSHAEIPYILTTGEVVADNWNDLTDGSVQIPISIDENASVPSFIRVWTSTLPDGGKTPYDCGYFHSPGTWLNGSGASLGKIGSLLASDSSWTNKGLALCNASFGLYCFEQ